MKRYRKNTRLEVYWDDIVSNPCWQDNKDAEQVSTIPYRTIGYYTMSRKNVLVLSHTTSKDQRDSTAIPIGCITKIIELRE